MGVWLNRHPGLDPGYTFVKRLKAKKKDGCRIKSGMTTSAIPDRPPLLMRKK
jgi:hypothetical protein